MSWKGLMSISLICPEIRNSNARKMGVRPNEFKWRVIHDYRLLSSLSSSKHAQHLVLLCRKLTLDLVMSLYVPTL